MNRTNQIARTDIGPDDKLAAVTGGWSAEVFNMQ